MTNSRKLKQMYSNMKYRCLNPKNPGYPRYGARGIKICQEWLDSYNSFYEWAFKNGYNEVLSIDRIDNDGDYTPENCQFITKEENHRKGKKTISEWNEFKKTPQKQVIFNVTEADHLALKLEATRRKMTMRDFIMYCVRRITNG